MPLYDRKCDCGWQAVDVWEAVHAENPPCPTCGEPTQRAWFTKASTVIGDAMHHWQKNGTKTPILFTSKLERKRWLKANNYREVDTHVPEQGSDKSKFTTNWAAQYDPYTANNVKILLERAFKAPIIPDEPLDMTIHTYTGTLTTEEAERYVKA